MLTEREMKLVEQYARIVSQTYSFPFDWKNGRLSPTKSKFKFILVSVNFLFSCAYFIYITLRLSKQFGGYTINSFPFHAFAIICHCLYISFHLHMYIYTAEMAALFNQLKYFNINQGKLHVQRSYHLANIRENVIRFLHRWINGVACTIAALFLAVPNNTHFLYSAVPQSHQTSLVHFLFFLIEAFLAYKVMVFHLFVILFGFFYIVSTNFWVKKVCIEWSISAQNVDPDKVEEDIRLYRPLTLLNNLYNNSFASLIIPVFKTLIEICVVVCTYGTIRLYGSLDITVYILLPGLASFLFVEHQFAVDRMALVHENSSKICENYQRNYLGGFGESDEGDRMTKHKKYVRKFIGSCRPLRCQLTHALFVEKSTRLVLLHMLLNWLVTLLLGDKEGTNP